MPVQRLPSVQERARYFSEQVKGWIAAAGRNDAQRAAFWATVEHLKHARFGAAGLAASFVFRDYFWASLDTGELIACRFGMLPPVAGVFILYVGTDEEVAAWTPTDDGLS